MATTLIRVYTEDNRWIKDHKTENQSAGDKIHQLIVDRHNHPYDVLEMENRKLKNNVDHLIDLLREKRGG